MGIFVGQDYWLEIYERPKHLFDTKLKYHGF